MVKRFRWILLAVVASVLIILAAKLWIGKPPLRKEYIDRIDPSSGYRCRFTVASDWTILPGEPNAADNDEATASFIEAPLSPIKQWVKRHLFYQSLDQPAQINMVFADAKRIHQYIPMSIKNGNGYPVPTVYFSQRIVATRHVIIDGCAATIITVENMHGLPPYHGTEFYVFGPHTSILWEVFAFSGNSNKTDREMQAIISSFHVEKVVVPIEGKR